MLVLCAAGFTDFDALIMPFTFQYYDPVSHASKELAVGASPAGSDRSHQLKGATAGSNEQGVAVSGFVHMNTTSSLIKLRRPCRLVLSER